MREAGKTALLSTLPAVLVATAWLRLEDGPDPGTAAALVVLALLPGLPGPWWARLGAAGAVVLGAVPLVFGLNPLDARPWNDEHDFFGPLLTRIRDGFLEFYDVRQPFVVPEHPDMHEIVLAAIFAFCLVLALAVAWRRPLIASAVLLGGSIWPATLVPGDDAARGALTLASVLLLLSFGGRGPARSPRPALVAGTLLVAAAVGASASSAVAKDEFVEWRGWDPYDRPADPVGVDYVWNASYDGIEWPEKETRVLTVKGPTRELYWRATTLDSFEEDRWVEDTETIVSQFGQYEVFDPLLPGRAHEEGRWVRAAVTVEALRDEYLVGPSMPVVYDPKEGIGRIDHKTGGVAAVPEGLERGDTYTVWAFAPSPTPKQLARVRPPTARRGTLESRYLEVAPGLPVLPLFADEREERLENLFDRFERLAAYRPLYAAAREIVGRPQSQYAAVFALESWFRVEGNFRYDEQPPLVPGGAPPLVDFVQDHRRGYCQLYAGAMTLMLRFLGIPARVAVGFTSGDPDEARTTWAVTDRDAHAWVEVWFDGWGWLPFDPTPARGQFSSPYSFAGSNLNIDQATEALGGATATGFSAGLVDTLTQRKAGEQLGGRDVPGDVGTGAVVRDRGQSLVVLLVIVAAATAAAIALAKEIVRRTRYATRDPRRLAAACRSELTDVIADQGVAIPRAATPRELRAEVERYFAVDLGTFVEALEAARYGPEPEARAAARRARRELRALRRRLRRSVGVPARLRGAVSLRCFAA